LLSSTGETQKRQKKEEEGGLRETWRETPPIGANITVGEKGPSRKRRKKKGDESGKRGHIMGKIPRKLGKRPVGEKISPK